MKFNLTQATAKLNSFNVRAEKHGDEEVPACDLKLTIHAANTILGVFYPDLCAAFYCNNAGDSGQFGFEGLPATLPNLRFKNLEGPIKFKDAGAGYTLVIDQGIDDQSNIVLLGCEVNNFAADLQEGGTVELTFRVQITNPNAETIGRLGVLVQHELTIDLHAPEVDSASVTPIKKKPRKKMSADEAQLAIADAMEASA